ncbi:MAG TPA: inorganic phosphate transporter [Candidatus Acidoferrum sp.]|nr:inorganic phosphate transporter [Candidatus Acidoferrum sp.]
MVSPLHMVFFLIGLAFVFDVFNGFHDAANSVATVVTTRVLSPIQAVFWAAFFNFVAAFVFGTGVAKTISDKLIDPKVVDLYVIFGGLIGAIVWDIITWLMALPTSSSHAIISAYAGGAIAKAGFHSLLLKGWVPVITFLVVSPIIGLILGYIFMVIASWFSHTTERHKAERTFSRLQLISAGAYSLGHGTNDAQKTMGIIAALLVSSGKKEWTQGHFHFLWAKHELALWIILSCHAAMAIGTMLGGWRIVKTMGSRITPHLHPMGGFSAELAAATTIGLATIASVPISTTHAIGGAVSGVGATRGAHAVRWIWGQRIVWGWLLTFPGAAILGAFAYWLGSFALKPFIGQ